MEPAARRGSLLPPGVQAMVAATPGFAIVTVGGLAMTAHTAWRGWKTRQASAGRCGAGPPSTCLLPRLPLGGPTPHRSACAGDEDTTKPWLKPNVHTPAAHDPEPGQTRKRPYIYVYELPGKFNTHMLQVCNLQQAVSGGSRDAPNPLHMPCTPRRAVSL